MILRQMLYRCEIRFLPVIAGFWSRTRPQSDYEELIRSLCGIMLDRRILLRFFNSDEGRQLIPAVRYLILSGGTETAEAFESAFGSLRVAGIDRICRKKLWKDPISVTEKCWYRGLIFRENRFLRDELKECFILPDDLKMLLSGILSEDATQPVSEPVPFVVRPASPAETQNAAAPDRKLPDLITHAAALKRDGRSLDFPGSGSSESYIRFLDQLTIDTGMFSSENDPEADNIRNFLVENRTAARLDLIRAWRNSSEYNEITEERELLHVEEVPSFDVSIPRGRILEFLSKLEPDTWWSLDGFTAAVKREYPDFLRSAFTGSAGRIFDPEGNDLSGIGSWFQLEGVVIRFLISGPLQWLGIVQIASDDSHPSAFRISREGLFYLLESKSDSVSEEITGKPNLEHDAPNISADGAIVCSAGVPRYFRYMAARCCETEKITDDRFTFRLTPGSMADARRAGINGDTFLKLLRRFAGKSLPPSLEHMLSGENSTRIPATIYNATILTVPDADILDELAGSSRAGKWVIQKINATSLLIDVKGINEIRRFLMEKEIFVDVRIPRT